MIQNSEYQPLVSVITAVYNGEKTIATCVQSVLNQTYENIELIIINDGSTDKTLEIINRLSKTDSRIQTTSQKNKGVSSARNVGLAAIKGDFFCFIDADDAYPKRSIEHRMNKFEENETLDFVDGYVNYIDITNNELLKVFEPNLIGNPWKDLALIQGKSFCAPTWLIKRNKNTIYKFEEHLTHGEDLAFFMTISLKGNYSFCKEVILSYNQSIGSAMNNLEGLGEFYLYHLIFIRDNHLNKEISIKEYKLLKKQIRMIMTKSHFKKSNWRKGLQWFTLNLNKI